MLLLCAYLPGCSDGVYWSGRERDNASHLLASLNFTSEAASVANAITSDTEYQRRKGELLQALRAAHWNAAQVDDAVLDKLHPQLYGRFRLSYQRAIAAMIRAYERDDSDAAQKAANDVRTFVDWYRRENHNFRWWDEAAPR